MIIFVWNGSWNIKLGCNAPLGSLHKKPLGSCHLLLFRMIPTNLLVLNKLLLPKLQICIHTQLRIGQYCNTKLFRAHLYLLKPVKIKHEVTTHLIYLNQIKYSLFLAVNSRNEHIPGYISIWSISPWWLAPKFTSWCSLLKDWGVHSLAGGKCEAAWFINCHEWHMLYPSLVAMALILKDPCMKLDKSNGWIV